MQEFADTTTWLFDVFSKSSVLLIMVGIGSLMIRGCSAAAQHRWWTLAFGGCLLIPLVATLTPTWTPPLVPHMFVSELGDSSQALDAGHRRINDVSAPVPPTHEVSGLPKFESGYNDTHEPAASSSTMGMSVPAYNLASNNPQRSVADVAEIPDAREAASAQPGPYFRWSSGLIVLWGCGALAVLLRTACQHWILRRMLKTCTAIRAPELLHLMNGLSDLLNIKRKVVLLQHTASHSPITAGVLRPSVLLPAEAAHWNTEQQRLVLLHELAHVSRRDLLAQTLATLGCAVYWFNPIAWFGLLQMRKLRELACDDLVLSFGQPPSGYAGTLLDIARTHKHHAFSTAVGMTHCNNVEYRIMAILDSTRRHLALSRNAARTLLAFAVVLVALVGTAQLRSQADSPLQQEQQADVEQSVDDEAVREMKIRVMDVDGKPLEGAKLRVAVWYIEGYEGYKTPKDHISGADGTIVLTLPQKLDILRLWPNKANYVGGFKGFERGTHRDGELIPEEFEFQLARGHKISGRVIDSDGKPVEGVHVRVKLSDEPDLVSTWLTDSFYQPTVKTDADGRWELNNAPAVPEHGGDYKFSLKLEHDNFVTDAYWGESQRAQGIQSSDLRQGNATIVLNSGTSIRGMVTDSSGEPITKGWVVWRDEPYFADGVYEAELKSDGSFLTLPLNKGKHPVTIVAPGFAAQRLEVEVGSGASEQAFQLRPGKRITIRVIDSAGQPVPKAYVGIASSSHPKAWQGSNAIHNHKHPNVPEYGIPRNADEDGVYVWDWAPEEPVTYHVSAKGFKAQEVALVAKEDPHIITLPHELVAAGLVTDATTGKPIHKFEVIPVVVFRPDFFHTSFQNAEHGTDGQFKLSLRGGGDPSYRYRVRFEASGYRSTVSEESIGPYDGFVTVDAQLEPAPMRQGRVLDADGIPVADASVLEASSTWVPDTNNGKPNSYGERIIKTDRDGRFELLATDEPVLVRVIHERGMVETHVQPDQGAIGDVTVQPWAQIKGRLVQDGIPISNHSIYFRPLVRGTLGEPRFQDSYYALTSEDGTFNFDRLPPGAGSLQPDLSPWRDFPITSAKSTVLELVPGENRQVILGDSGALLTGQVIATGRNDVPLDHNWSLNYLISREPGLKQLPAGFPALSFDPSMPIQPAWSLDPHFNDWIAARENHFVKLKSDGTLRVHGVAPGDYDLLIRLYEQPAGCLVETVGERIVPVHVDRSGKIDLGRIEVPCRVGPRPGSDMRAFSFTDVTGKKQLVNDLEGSYALMHVWASWCAPCIESMPDIKHLSEELSGRGITFVGLNIDDDLERAKAAANRHRLTWAQNYLGENSALAKQLALSSVPAYYFIGPDGKLIASDGQWKEIKKKLVTTFKLD